MVEQKGTNNNAGFPVINAKRIAKATPAQKDKQKSQLRKTRCRGFAPIR